MVSRIFKNCIDKFYLVNSLGIFFACIFCSRTRYNEPPAPRCFTWLNKVLLLLLEGSSRTSLDSIAIDTLLLERTWNFLFLYFSIIV